MIKFGVLRGGGFLALYVCAVFVLFLGPVEAQHGDQNAPYSMIPGIESSISLSNNPSADRNARLERRHPVRTPIRSQRVPLFPVDSNTGNAPSSEGTQGYTQPPQPNTNIIFPDDEEYPHSSFVPNSSPVIDEPVIVAVNDVGIADIGQPIEDSAIELPENMDVDKMSIDDMRMMSNIGTMEDFARTFGVDMPDPYDDNNTDVVAFGRFGAGAKTKAMPASCEPEAKVVRLKLPMELNVMYYPRCVRLQRCGGCCTGLLLKCQPTKFEPVTLQILRVSDDPSSSAVRSADVDGGTTTTINTGRRRPVNTGRRRTGTRSNRRRRQTSRYYTVSEENHVACACKCRIQEEDCTPDIHEYMSSECQCQCKNRDEKEKCSALSSSHYWDPATCKCYCHKTHSCSTGQYFNHSSCSCKNDGLNNPSTDGMFGLSPRFGGPENPTPARDYEAGAEPSASIPVTF